MLTEALPPLCLKKREPVWHRYLQLLWFSLQRGMRVRRQPQGFLQREMQQEIMGTSPWPDREGVLCLTWNWSLPSVLSMGKCLWLAHYFILGCCRDIIANELVRELSKSHVVAGKMLLKDFFPVLRYVLFSIHTDCLIASLGSVVPAVSVFKHSIIEQQLN